MYGSARSSTPFTIVNTAVLAPMPTARAMTATAVNPGLRRRLRSA